MSIVTVEFDNTLEKTEIVMPLFSSSPSEAGESYDNANLTDKAQTAVFGVQVPLIMINSTIIDFDAIKYFSLSSVGCLPGLTLTVEDRYELITNIDKPTNDNEVRIQILPRHNNTYKKIDLTFYITNISVLGSLIKLNCVYKVSSVLSSQFKTFGQIDTYNLFKTIATETKLGFASNIADTSNDNRYVYCDNKSYLDLMKDEICYSNCTDYILDWWVDFWDNINLVDIKDRYTTVDSDDDLLIWIAGQVNDITVDNEPEPIQIPAVVHNNPAMQSSELFVKQYVINNSPGRHVSSGSDKLCGIYSDFNEEYTDFLIQDGDTKNDIFTKYDYLGENYGEYNYMLSRYTREGFIQKINTNQVKITLQSPLLALMRGHKVNFIRYVNNDIVENRMKNLEDAGVIDRNIESNIPLNQYEVELDGSNGKFRIDRTVSGQYLITEVVITYNDNKWNYDLTLIKPNNASSIIKTE